MSDIDHTRDCILPSDGKAEGLVKASEMFALAAERDALRAENERLRAALEGIADLPPGYADMRQDDLVVILANKARAAMDERK